MEVEQQLSPPFPWHPPPATAVADPKPISGSSAAVKLQKVYRSYRTRRRLADSAVLAEELWWLAIDYARQNHNTVSFFNNLQPETPHSRWNRVTHNASKVGKGLSENEEAKELAFQHWIEAIDPRHRYGHNLHYYYEEWSKGDAGQPFFYWLDLGDGKDVDLKECRRSLLRQQCIRYLGPQEREHFEYTLEEGKVVHKQTGNFLDTKGSGKGKWIFVMSTSKRLYAGQKKKGAFHHSSFLAGGATLAAGRLVAENGNLKHKNELSQCLCIACPKPGSKGGMLAAIWAYSGHYRPSEENLKTFTSFIEENGVDLKEIQILSSSNEDFYDDSKATGEENTSSEETFVRDIPLEVAQERPTELVEITGVGTGSIYQRTLSGGLQSPRANLSPKAVLDRINSKNATCSYQLGHQLSRKWSTGAGPRIGCVADYPPEVRLQALEFVKLSPRLPPTPPYKQLVNWSNLTCGSPCDGHNV